MQCLPLCRPWHIWTLAPDVDRSVVPVTSALEAITALPLRDHARIEYVLGGRSALRTCFANDIALQQITLQVIVCTKVFLSKRLDENTEKTDDQQKALMRNMVAADERSQLLDLWPAYQEPMAA
ncbi:hypothetical protein NDU88_006612 [Pleurodeles waltl]|uniref:Uncharacterized protein n=1 Tax=Pleurodeles waltl TaxID=8319 RepID=A0AAV7X1K8_PLEWA|nr:hypothetical protein NDU88_006612 [Pleurodeles waltl]